MVGVDGGCSCGDVGYVLDGLGRVVLAADVEGAVFVTTAQTAHFADFVRLIMAEQLCAHRFLRAGQHTGAAVAQVCFFALIFGSGEIVEGSCAVNIGISDEEFFCNAGQCLVVGRAVIALCEAGNSLEEVVGQALAFAGGQCGEIFRHSAWVLQQSKTER